MKIILVRHKNKKKGELLKMDYVEKNAREFENKSYSGYGIFWNLELECIFIHQNKKVSRELAVDYYKSRIEDLACDMNNYCDYFIAEINIETKSIIKFFHEEDFEIWGKEFD